MYFQYGSEAGTLVSQNGEVYILLTLHGLVYECGNFETVTGRGLKFF